MAATGLSKRLNLEVSFAFAEQLPVGPKLVFVKGNPSNDQLELVDGDGAFKNFSIGS